MPRRWTARSLVLLALLVSAGCATPTEPFFQRRHRETYALQDAELKRVQFYISTEVLAKDLDPRASGTAAGVVILPEETPGVATEVGPNWIRVSFMEGGSGAPFVAMVGQSGDSAYWLATQVEGRSGYVPVKDLKEKVLRAGGRTFKLVYGSSARLLINSEDLQKLIETRSHIPGRTKGSD
jgi:hypothetical protein